MTCPLEASTAHQFDIAICGGAFDPFSIAHEILGLITHAQTGYEFWYMPCYSHRFAKKMASPGHRLNMCERVIQNMGDWAKVSSFEIERCHDGSTFDSLVELKKTYPNYRFHLVVGMDNFNEIEAKWHRGVELISQNSFIVIGRAGHPLRDKAIERPNVFYIDFHFTCSSTDIRAYIENGEYEIATRLMKPQVKEYIAKFGLYGWGEKNAKV